MLTFNHSRFAKIITYVDVYRKSLIKKQEMIDKTV